MKRWQKVATMIASAALVAGGGVAWAAGTESDRAPGNNSPGAAAAVAAAPIDTAVESRYTPITPCRIVDTRKAGGKLAAGATRSFIAEGASGFPNQGGKSGGCGVPANATALQATVIAVNATGSGYLRTYPDNATVPDATAVSYTKSTTGNSGSLTLHTPGTFDFKVSNFRSATHVVVDVQGYYIKPMWAQVNSDGTLIGGSRVIATKKVDDLAGRYEVTFDRDVSQCGYSATPFFIDHAVEVEPRFGVPNAVWVGTASQSGGAYIGARFYLTVTC